MCGSVCCCQGDVRMTKTAAEERVKGGGEEENEGSGRGGQKTEDMNNNSNKITFIPFLYRFGE